MTRIWLSVANEERLLDELAQRRRSLNATRARITPQIAMEAEAYADAYPWMDPSASQAFLQAGVPADDPRIQQAAQLAAQDIPSESIMDDAPDAWWESLLDHIGQPVKAGVRGIFTAFEAPIEELQSLISSAGVVAAEEEEFESGGGFSLAGLLGDIGELPEDLREFWDNYTKKAAPSAGRMAISNLLRGEEVDLGEGFLPGSYTEQTMAQEGFSGGIYGERERLKHRLELDGTFVTPGRLVARDVTEPGTKMYSFVSGASDAALRIWADPTEKGLKALSRASRASRTFQRTGLINGPRKTVSPERAVQHYLTSRTGQQLKRWMTDTTDARQIWDATGRADLRLANAIAEAADETTVHNLLSDALGTVVREKPTASFVNRGLGRVIGGNSDYGKLFGGGAVVRKGLNSRNVRLINDMPATSLNVHDVNASARELELWLRNAKMGDEVVSHYVGRLAREVADGDANAMLNVVTDAMRDTRGVLVSEWGLRESRARKLTKMWDDMVQDHRAFQVDDLGNEIGPWAFMDGKSLDMSPGVGITSDIINNAIPLPDARELRRLTPTIKKLQGFYDSGLWKGSMDVLDTTMSMVWKPLQLLRGAYTARVIGEEQIRMAASGMDSLASHPIKAIAAMVSIDPSSKLGRRIARSLEIDLATVGQLRTRTQTLVGEGWDELAEHMAAMSRGSAGHTKVPGEVATGRWTKVKHGEDVFHTGWAARFGHLHADPVMQRLAGGLSAGDIKSIRRGLNAAGEVVPDAVKWSPRGNDIDDVFQWWWSGGGQKFRKELAVAHGDEAGNLLLNSRDIAKDYFRHNYVDQLERLTGGNSDLMGLVARGELGDVNIRSLGNEKKLARILEDAYDDAAPGYIPMEDRLTVKSSGLRTLDRLDKGTEYAFGALMSKPTNYLSRSPAFREFYYKRASELIGFADEATQTAIIKAAKEANVGDDLLKEMASNMLKGPGTKLSSLDDVDLLAKGFALDSTKQLLYDLSKRSQFFDMMRIVFPFGEAWKEILTSWGRIMYQNPQAVRRAQQVIHGARGGDQDPSTGFFHTDPQTGDEVFSYPDFGLSKWLLGTDDARVTPVGRVAGLNIVAATVLPGFGPMVQIPVQNLVPNKPGIGELVNELVNPFGQQPGETLGQQIESAFMPAWLEKVETAIFSTPESDRLFANTVMDVMRALHRSGKYPLDSPDGMQRLEDDAIDKARLLYFIRGIAQSGVPTGPSFSWETADAEGNLVPIKILSDELRRLTDEEYGGDRNAAFHEWVRRYGVDNVLAIQPKSQELVERPVTEQGDAWLRANQDLERTYPTTVGYFTPEPAVGEFNYDAYLRAFDTGARQAITPDEMLQLANDFLGRVEYEQAKRFAELRPGPQSAAWLAQVRADIAVRRPGFDSWVADRVRSQRPQVDVQIAEIRDAVTDPRIAQTEAGRGAIKYLSATQIAEQMVAGLGGNVRRYNTAKAAAPIRQFLRHAAQEIIAEHPDFARLWTGVFERELADDTELMLGGN